jgi:hypothetical protein
MKRKAKAPDTEFKPGKSDQPRKGGPPGTAEPAAPQSERSEDFGRRRDIETADEPVEEHDRRHHDQDAEVGRPA